MTNRRALGTMRVRLPGLHVASALYLLAAIFLIFSLWIPKLFLTTLTFKLVAEDQVVVAILALGLLVPLVGGTFDLSVGAMLAFSLVIITWLAQHTHINMIISCLIALVACAAVGWISGLVVVRYRVNSFIATLGMSQLLAAAALYISGDQDITGAFSKTFLSFGQTSIFDIPIVIFYLIALAATIWYLLEWTPLGRKLFAVGANPEAARLSGIRVDRMVWGSLVASATLAGLAGIVYGATTNAFSNSFGQPLLFPAFAAVFFGATQFRSRPNVWGTVLALYVLALGVQGLQLALANGIYWVSSAFDGLALLVAVGLASHSGAVRLRRKSLPAESAEPAEPIESASSHPGAS